MSVNDRAMAPSAPVFGAAARARARAGTLAAACTAVFVAQIAIEILASWNWRAVRLGETQRNGICYDAAVKH